MEKDFRLMLEELNARWLPAVLSGTAPLADVALVQDDLTAEEIGVTVMDVYSIDETIPEFVEAADIWNTWDNNSECNVAEENLIMMNTIGDETDPWNDESFYLEDGGEWIDPANCTITPELFRNKDVDSDFYFEEYNQADKFGSPQIFYMASSTAITLDIDNSSAQLLSALDTPADVNLEFPRANEVSVTIVTTEAFKPVSEASEHTETSVTPVTAVATPSINAGLTILADNRLSISLV